MTGSWVSGARIGVRLRSLFAALAVTAVVAMGATPARAAAPTQIEPGRYDAGLGAIVVPYTGPAPGYTQVAITPTRHFFDLSPARLSRPGLQRPAGGGAVERLWLANRPHGDAVRVAFDGTTALKPTLQVDAAHHRLLIFPGAQAAAASSSAAPSTAPSVRPSPVHAHPTTAPSPHRVAPTSRPTMRPASPRPRHTASPVHHTAPRQGAAPAIGRPALTAPGRLRVPGRRLDWHVCGSAADPLGVCVAFEGAVIGFTGERAAVLDDPTIAGWSLVRGTDGVLRVMVRFRHQPRLQIEADPDGLCLTAIALARPATRPAAPAATPRPVVTSKPAAPAVSVPAFVPQRPVARPTPPAPTRPAPALTPLAVVSPQPLPTARPTAPPVVKTHFARPYFDASRQAIVCPYVGEDPTYRLRDGAGGVSIDLPQAALQTPGRLMRQVSAPLLNSFQVTSDSGTLRLSLGMVRAGTAIVALDAHRRELLVFPQPAGTLGPASPVRTVFGRVGYDARLGAVVLTYFGRAPSFTLDDASNGMAAIDFLATAIEPAGAQFAPVSGMPLMSFWLAAPHRPDVVRLSVLLKHGGHVRVQDDAANHRLLVIPDLGPEPSPSP